MASWAASFSLRFLQSHGGEEGSGTRGRWRGSQNCQAWMIFVEVAGIGLNLIPIGDLSPFTWRISAITSLQAVDQSRHPALRGGPWSLKRGRRGAEQDLRPEVDGNNMAGIDKIDRQNLVLYLGSRVHTACRPAVRCRSTLLRCLSGEEIEIIWIFHYIV